MEPCTSRKDSREEPNIIFCSELQLLDQVACEKISCDEFKCDNQHLSEMSNVGKPRISVRTKKHDWDNPTNNNIYKLISRR